MKISLLILLTLLNIAPYWRSSAPIVVAQSNQVTESGCARIEKQIDLPVYITFTKVLKDDVILRLVNNTTCVIEVEALGPSGGMVAYPRSGGMKIGRDVSEQDGERWAISYDIENAKGCRIHRQKGDPYTTYVGYIQPGRSATFAVPLKALKKGHHVLVPVSVLSKEITFRIKALFQADDLRNDTSK